MKGVVLAVVLAACASDSVIQPTPKVAADARATYIQDTGALLAKPSAREKLERLVRSHRVTTVVPYGLGPVDRAQLQAWVDEIHRDGGRVVVPIAGVDRLTALASSSLWVDGFVSEVEFWNRSDRAAAFAELLALFTAMRGWNNHGHPFEIGAYLGYPTAAEAAQIAKAVEFVFLDYSVKSPDKAWNAMRGEIALRDRFGWFAGIAEWPIFYATGEVDMDAALRTAGLDHAEQRFRADASGRVAGFVYFTFEATPW